MIKKLIIAVLLAFTNGIGFSQDLGEADRIRIALSQAVNDTSRINLMVDLCSHYKFNNPDSALFYGYKALELSSKVNFVKGEIDALQHIVVTYLAIGDDAKALQLNLRSLKISRKHDLVHATAISLNELGRIYCRLQNFPEASKAFRESIGILATRNATTFSIIVKTWFSECFLNQELLDSAEYYAEAGYKQGLENDKQWHKHFALSRLAMVQHKKGNSELALQNLKLSSKSLTDHFDPSLLVAKIYLELNERDSSIFFADKALERALVNGFYSNLVETYSFLSILQEGDPKLALFYKNLAFSYKERLFNLGKSSASELFVRYDQRQQLHELERTKKEYRSGLRTNILLGCVFILLAIAFLLLRNNRLKQKAKQGIELAYDKLKSTQAQLIQSEKMASLGELTAGIAHEIQNPLNFVNNFSEVSGELIEEVKEELAKGEIKEAEEILSDLTQNLVKINHHGQRASSIVQGMLNHSRTSTGEKTMTDINKLCDEYLRLAYHGMRAKDKSFNANFETDFDDKLPKVNVVPQEIGRVILNIINNAFQACTERSRSAVSDKQLNKSTTKQKVGLVKVSTKLKENFVEIMISDNGPGIPDDIKNKIFQPFFTTKPTGQGTGLGLSLSYDIVKAHRAELSVNSILGEGTEMLIILPTTREEIVN